MEGDRSVPQARGSGPSTQDIQGSKSLLDVKRTLSQYREASTPAAKKEAFMSFSVFLLNFLISDSTASLIQKNISGFIKEVVKFVKANELKVSELDLTLRVLHQARSLSSINISREVLLRLMMDALREGCECDSVFERAREFFESVFSDKRQFWRFVESNRVWACFRYAFCESDNEDSGTFLTEILIQEERPELYSGFPYQDFCKAFREAVDEGSIKRKLASFAFEFVAKLVKCVSMENKDIPSFLVSSATLEKMDMLARLVVDVEARAKLYRTLLSCRNDDCSSTPNVLHLRHIHDIAETEPEMECSMFSLLVDFVSETAHDISVINDAVPFAAWFAFESIKVGEFTRLFEVLNEKAPEYVSVSIQLYLQAIERQDIDVNELEKCAMVIQKQRELGLITSSVLLNCDFLKAFVISQPDLNVGIILSDVSVLQMLSEMCCLELARSSMREALPVIMRAAEFFSSHEFFVTTVTLLLSHFPEIDMFQHLIEKCLDVSTVLNILQHIFLTGNEIAASNFVAAGGIKWLLQQSQEMDMVTDLIASIVSWSNFEEIEEAIAELPNTHPLFSVNQQWMEKMIYGRNGSNYRQIRVYSLLPFYTGKLSTDPYAAFMIGSKYLDHLMKRVTDIQKVPMLNQVANRYVHPKHVPILMQKSQSLLDFCDVAFDHFPLFQIYPGKEQLVFRIKCTSVSFWFKYIEPVSSSGAFFERSSLSLSFAHDNLVVKTDQQLFPVPIESNSWNFIGVKSGNDATITVNSDVFHLSNVDGFSAISFSTSCHVMLFLGSTIRFFTSPIDFTEIQALGPGSMKGFNEKSVNPYSFCGDSQKLNCSKPENCVVVPYYGFPKHLATERRYNALFLKAQNSPALGRLIFRSLLNVSSITRLDAVEFWYQMFLLLKNAKKIETYHECFRVISTFENSLHILETVLFNKSMWQKMNQTDLLSELLSIFTDVRLCYIPGFQLWLVHLLVKSQKPKNLARFLVKHAPIFPELTKYLSAMLKANYETCLPRRETPVQFALLEALVACPVQQIVTPTDLWSLIPVASPDYRAMLFMLLFRLADENPEYLASKRGLAIEIVSVAKRFEIWNELLTMCSKSMSKPRADLFPFLLMLIWYGSVCVIHSNVYDVEIQNLGDIEMLLQRTIKLLGRWIKSILDDADSMYIIQTFYPILFHYPCLMQMEFKQAKPFKQEISADEFPEGFDDLWSAFHGTLSLLDIPDFGEVFDLIKLFDFPVPFKLAHDINWANMSMILGFLTDIIVGLDEKRMQKLLHDLFFSPCFERTELVDKISPIMMHSLLEKLPYSFSPSFPLQLVIDSCYLLTGMHLMGGCAWVTIGDLFALYSTLKAKLPRKQLPIIATDIHNILLALFSEMPASSMVASLLSQNIDIFASLLVMQKSLHCWIYEFSKMALQDDKPLFLHFFARLKRVMKIDKADSDLLDQIQAKTLQDNPKIYAKLQDARKIKHKEFESKCSQLQKTPKITGEPEIFLLMEQKYVRDCKANTSHYLLAVLVRKSLRLLIQSLRMREEQAEWSVLVHSLRDPDNRETILLEKRKSKPRKSSEIEPTSTVDYAYTSPQEERPVLSSRSLDTLPSITRREGLPLHPMPFCWPFFCPRLSSISPFRTLAVDAHSLFQSFVKFGSAKESDFETNLISLFNRTHRGFGDVKDCLSCELVRYGCHIPGCLLLFRDFFVIITGASLSIEDIKLESIDVELQRFFLESVFMNHWGETAIFASRIVVVVRLDSIIFARETSPDSYAIWSLENGHFLLKMLTPSKMLSSTLEALSGNALYNVPEKFLFHLRTLSEVQSAWQESLLSTTDVIVWLNGLANRSFVDFTNYPLFPIMNTRLDRIQLIPEIYLFHRTSPQMKCHYSKLCCGIASQQQDTPNEPVSVPADLYFVALAHDDACDPIRRRECLEVSSSMTRTIEWAKTRFDVTLTPPQRATFLNIGSLDYIHVSQRLSATLGNSVSLIYEEGSIVKVPGNGCALTTLQTTAIVYQRERAMISAVNYKDFSATAKLCNPAFSFITSLSVGSDGTFFVVDLSIGLTLCFRIEYNHKTVRCFTKVSELVSTGEPHSVILSRDFLVATAVSNTLVLWTIFGATVHRTLTLDSPITSLSVDSEYGSFVVTTANQGLIINTNGETMISMNITGTYVTASTTMDLPLSETRRSSLLGARDGSVWLMSPRYDLGIAELQRLDHNHHFPIRSFIVHPSKRSFMSVDTSGNIVLWTATGLPCTSLLKLDLLSSCAFCERRPTSHCINCSRGVCDACMSERQGICHFCHSISCHL